MNRVSIGSDNGLSPIQRQAIIWTNIMLLLIWALGTNSDILVKIQKKQFIHENASQNIPCEMAAI